MTATCRSMLRTTPRCQFAVLGACLSRGHSAAPDERITISVISEGPFALLLCRSDNHIVSVGEIVKSGKLRSMSPPLNTLHTEPHARGTMRACRHFFESRSPAATTEIQHHPGPSKYRHRSGINPSGAYSYGRATTLAAERNMSTSAS